MRERKEFLQLAAALALFFWHGVVVGQATLERIVGDNKAATVFLHTKVTLPTGEIQESTGTGFLLSSEGYVLTASHVLSPAGIYDRSEILGSVKTRYGQSWPMDVIEDNPHRDLLLLKFKDVDIKWQAASLGAPTQTAVGAKLFALGYPLAEDLAAKEGSLSNKNGPGGSWITTVPLNLGDSGAPIFNEKGQVVAIVVGGIAEARGIAYCLPLNYAATFLSISGVSLSSEQHVSMPARPRLLSPPDGATLTSFPRKVKLDWTQVQGSRSYRLQLEMQDPETSVWSPHPSALGERVVGAPPFNLEFAGTQSGRWRVAAISDDGEQGEFSAWSYFTFEDRLVSNERVEEFPFTPSILLKYKFTWKDQPCIGYFLSDGQGRWAEITLGRNGCIESAYSFEQVSSGSGAVLLHDPSRKCFVKVPLDGGWASIGASEGGPFSFLHFLEKDTFGGPEESRDQGRADREFGSVGNDLKVVSRLGPDGMSDGAIVVEDDRGKQYMGRLETDEFCKQAFGSGFRSVTTEGATTCTDGLSVNAFSVADACNWAYGSEDYTVEVDSASIWCSIKNVTKPPCRSGQRSCGASSAFCCPAPRG